MVLMGQHVILLEILHTVTTDTQYKEKLTSKGLQSKLLHRDGLVLQVSVFDHLRIQQIRNQYFPTKISKFEVNYYIFDYVGKP